MPVDFSEITNPVVRTAGRIAKAHKGEVVLFHAVSPAIYIPYPESLSVDVIDIQILQEIEESKKREAQEKLTALQDFLEGVNTRAIVDVGDPRDLILEHEEKEDPDLTLIGSHKKGLVERVLIGSTAEKVVKHSKKPVMVLKGSEPSFEKKALIAYDFSKTAERTLEFAIKFLKPLIKEVEILHIDEPLDIPLVERIGTELYKKYRDEKKNYVEGLKERFSSEGFHVSTSFLAGKDPAKEIAQYVSDKKDIDLLIMGSRGLSGLKRVLLGSTSTEVFRKVEVPILIYKEGSND